MIRILTYCWVIPCGMAGTQQQLGLLATGRWRGDCAATGQDRKTSGKRGVFLECDQRQIEVSTESANRLRSWQHFGSSFTTSRAKILTAKITTIRALWAPVSVKLVSDSFWLGCPRELLLSWSWSERLSSKKKKYDFHYHSGKLILNSFP